MPSKIKQPVVLRWSERVRLSDVQDPLGLGLRGSARLASRLLFCITSITQRARYYSFLAWCFHDFLQREKNRPHALGLRDAIVVRENALTLGCVAHHDGKPCLGGGVVGSDEGKRWLARGNRDADLTKLKLAKIPALNIYFTSLANLGCFVTEEDMSAQDEVEEASEDTPFTFDEIKLDALGIDLARKYEEAIGSLPVIRRLSSATRSASIKDLAKLGAVGGLCELTTDTAPDRALLRDVFFARRTLKGDSHAVRRRSLLLTLELCRAFSADGWAMSDARFASAVYFGELVCDDGRLAISIPSQLADIATRWRMFYFHHYMAVALEGLFAWLVTQLSTRGLKGSTIDELVAGLNQPLVRKTLRKELDLDLSEAFGQSSPAETIGYVVGTSDSLDTSVSARLEAAIKSGHPIAEDTLEEIIRSGQHAQSAVGLAVPLILLAVTLGRYAKWDESKYGVWLANAAKDSYLDLIPPLVLRGLVRQFGSWWTCRWDNLAKFVLSRFVVQQHQAMSYEKTVTGERCLIEVDGTRLTSMSRYDKIGLGNPRLRRAIQILKDLALVQDRENGTTSLTPDGTKLLKEELAKEINREVR